METISLVRDWLKQLGVRIAPAMAPEEFAGRIAVLAEDLASEFPTEVFTPASMRSVARKCRYWPNYAEICEALEPVLRQHRESRRYAIEHAGGSESQQPYEPGPAPEWCFNRGKRATSIPSPKPLCLSRGQLNEAYRREGIQGPQSTTPPPANDDGAMAKEQP